MATDIAINSELNTTFTGTGDLQTVAGAAQIQQAVVISVVETVDLRAPTLVDRDIEQQRAQIQQAVAETAQTRPPYEVTVAEIDYDEQTIRYRIGTDRITLTLEAE